MYCRKGKHDADKYRIKGIDVSHYQKYIDWQRVARDTSLRFVFLKATEARTMQDTTFKRNWAALGSTRLKRGAYHFFRPTLSAELQAANFVQAVTLRKGDLPPVLDVETTDGVNKNTLISKIGIWLRIVEDAYQVKPIIYANESFYNQYLATHFTNYRTWIARYSRYEPSSNWSFWQYSDWGRVDGIPEQVDINVFYGSKQQLDRICIK